MLHVAGTIEAGWVGRVEITMRNREALINSYATGDITGGKTNGTYANIFSGGLMGYSHVISLKNSYATGTVAGGDRAGGLVGGSFDTGASIENS